MEIRERLAAVIRQSGVSQAEVARRIGEERTWVNNRLTGYSALKLDELALFAHALGKSPCDLACEIFEDHPQREPQSMGDLRNATDWADELTQEFSERLRGRLKTIDQRDREIVRSLLEAAERIVEKAG